MTGTVNVYIPRTADGELMTGAVPKHRLPKVRSVDVRTFFDPLADHNLPNAIPAPKARPFNPSIAPKGWRLAPKKESSDAVRPVSNPACGGRPVSPVSQPQGRVSPDTQAATGCPRCGRSGFRRSGTGLAWHVERCAVTVAA